MAYKVHYEIPGTPEQVGTEKLTESCMRLASSSRPFELRLRDARRSQTSPGLQ